jgi:peptidase C13-like protein/YcxB-like protein
VKDIMKIEAELTTKDYETFYVVAARRALAGKSALYALIVGVSIAAWFALSSIVQSLVPGRPFVQVFAFLIAYTIFYYFWSRYARRAAGWGGASLGPRTFSLTPEGFEERGPLSSSLSQWPAVRAIEETPEHLFVFTDETVAHIVPRRCFATPEEYEAFVQELWERVWEVSDARVAQTSSRRGMRRLVPRLAFALVAVFVVTSLLSKAPGRSTAQDHEEVSRRATDEEREEAEALLYAQSALVEKQTAALLPERPGVVDAYFVGFGSSAEQDVFMKEVFYAQDLFDRRFDTRGRSAVLINNPRAKEETPLASYTNLRATLRHLGRVMNPEEDILFLLLSSHGSKGRRLSVDYWPLPLKQLSSADIAKMLREAGIKWRVVIISACYSGGFIDKLKDDHAVIITSSTATKPSYGCGEDDDLTYFGKAFLEDQLSQGLGILEAFTGAADLVRRREAARKLPASEPQLSSAPAITAKLRTLETRLASASCCPRKALK